MAGEPAADWKGGRPELTLPARGRAADFGRLSTGAGRPSSLWVGPEKHDIRQPDKRRSAPVSETTVADATESIYASLQADNADLDAHIATLKAALKREGLKEAVFDPARLVQNNRSGRKLMQAYFRQRGVTVKFEGA